MKAAYSGNARPFVLVLASGEDRERVRPVLEELDARGLEFAGIDGKASEDMAQRACATLAFLSEHTASDEALRRVLLTALAVEENDVIPVRLDDTPQGEATEGLLYAQNAISAGNYSTPAELADRIATAKALQSPKLTQAQRKAEGKLRNLMRVVAAVALVGIVALVWRGVSAASGGGGSSAASAVRELGITEEDLESIREVIIVGEHFAYYTEDDLNDAGDSIWILDVASQEVYDDGSSVFFWHGDEDADGEAAVHTTYDDLSFLTLMPNLDYLYAAEADLSSLPSLSEIGAIDDVAFYNCELGNLDWLADTPVHQAVFFDCDVDDLSPLSSCSNLETVRVDARGNRVSVEGFAPKNLGILQLSSVADADLAPLADCPSLRSLRIDNSDISDFSFLEGMSTLHELELSGLEQARDLSPLATCTNLKTLHLDNLGNLQNLDFLRSLTMLTELELYGDPLESFDFLENLNVNFDKIGFSCDGSIGVPDMSGFAHLTNISNLHMDVNVTGSDFETQVQPYIQHIAISGLQLSNCNNIDLAALSNVRDSLEIDGGDLASLEGIQSDSINKLVLTNLQYLTSLAGIEGISRFTQDYNFQGSLEINNCPRLSDYGALANVFLGSLTIKNMLSLPDFADVHTTELQLENIAGVSDLGMLEALPEGEYHRFSFLGFDELTDLTPLRRLGGELLQVPPQVADQAAELVDEGIFKEFEVVFPEGGWNADDIEIELLSLDELGTLSPALLEHVRRLELIGDEVYPTDTRIELDNFNNDGQSFDIVIRDEQGEVAETRAGSVGVLEGFDTLAGLTGLRELRLYAQGMTSLDGIQQLGSLEGLDINWTWTVEDFSPVFALPSLRWLSLPGVGITSIQGIQNLGELEDVTLSWNTELTDLTPLLDCPNLALVRVSSDMEEAIASLDGTDYSFELEIEQAGE